MAVDSLLVGFLLEINHALPVFTDFAVNADEIATGTALTNALIWLAMAVCGVSPAMFSGQELG